jgi:serine/threonine protein kinase
VATECPKCDLDNPSDSKFCKECGTQLTPSDSIPDVTKTIEIPAQELTRGIVFADRYEIIEQLGIGGIGEVYRVKDIKLDEEMALKVLRPEITAYKGTI